MNPINNIVALLQRLSDRKEKLRIKHHLLGAKWKYDQNTTKKEYTRKQTEIRETTSQRLSTYITRGKFPKNTEHDHYAPAIRDKSGTLCAMAYLIDESGDHQLVDELDQEGRYKYIREFHSDQLPQWLETNTMHLDEAVRIQPQYHPIAQDYYFLQHPFKFAIILAQILIFSFGIGLYLLKFRSKKLQLYVQQDKPNLNVITYIGLFTLVFAYLFPMFGSTVISDGWNDISSVSIWLMSPTLGAMVFPFLLLIVTIIFYVNILLGRFFHPVFVFLLVISTSIYVFLIIYYAKYLGFVAIYEGITYKKSGTSVGYLLYHWHFIFLTVISIESIIEYRKLRMTRD